MTNPPPRTCNRCKKPKPETLDNFTYRRDKTKVLKFQTICRECVRNRDRLRPSRHYSQKHNPTYAFRDRSFEQSTKICSVCQNMSWCRPVEVRCKCGGLYAPEPKPELILRRHFEKAV